MGAEHQKTPLATFQEKIADRSALIGIIGMGYVGQPLALGYSNAGFNVLGFDINQDMVAMLNSGHSPIEHIKDAQIADAINSGMEATSDFSRIAEADAIIICVPTPLNKYREPDLSFVIATCDTIGKYARSGQVISLESTTYPGTTEEVVIGRVTHADLLAGTDIFIVYSPEREDPGNKDFTTETIPKVLGGHTSNCLTAGHALYGAVFESLVPVSSTRAAEMTKLLENIQRAVNIGLINEMKIVADHMGIDIFEVVDAAATKPFGFTPYYPGPGIGGHCIPVDPFYLTWKAKEYGLHTRFIELAGEINQDMTGYVTTKLVDALNEAGKPMKGSKVLVLGIAYKKNVDDVRESPAIEIMDAIAAKGATVAYSDPHVPTFPKMRNHHYDLSSVALSPESIAAYDAVVLTTDHAGFDYKMIATHARLIVDTRGAFRSYHAENITRA